MSVLQANGTAAFDGLSAVNIALAEDTNQALATTLAWSGTYSVQANCVATLNITSGDSATLNVMVFNQGKNFQFTGTDATYSYSGTGNSQPTGTTCSVATLNGVYTANATGYQLASNAVSGVVDAVGLFQFDGQGNVAVDITVASSSGSSEFSESGSYTMSADCTGSATIPGSNSQNVVFSLSIYSNNPGNTNFYVSVARASNFLISGGGHTAYGQPATASMLAAPLSARTISGGTCSPSDLNGTYSLVLSGRGVSAAGTFTGSYQAVGTAAFDGQGNVTLAGTANTDLAQDQVFSYPGTYTISNNCSGTLTATTAGAPPPLTLVVWGAGGQVNMVGANAKYVYSVIGGKNQPPACGTSTLSGEYTFTASGFTLPGTTQNGSQDEAGVFEFDGQGNVMAKYTDTQGGTPAVPLSAMGNYTVTSGCLASATLTDSAGNANALNFVISGLHGEGMDLILASSQFDRIGAAHSAFLNPSQSIGNVASYAYSATPAGSVFVLFGQNLSSKPAQAVTVPLPNKLLNTSVTVNGELAPLFYVDSTQIDAQMPWNIPGNAVASVIVTNGDSASNAAAVYVPATGTPGISEYSNDRAVVVNPGGNLNSGAAPASVGEEVVVYFTGGGPVQASGQLTTGAASPGGLSPVTGDNSITVGSVPATVKYVGLTPGSVGLYQANFIVPQIAKGTYPVVLTIGGQASNNPVMTVSN
jgi:uncharacterized protein (TIGR03437 family)